MKYDGITLRNILRILIIMKNSKFEDKEKIKWLFIKLKHNKNNKLNNFP